MSDSIPLCAFRKDGRIRRIRTDEPGSWISQGYELIDCTHADEKAIQAAEAKAAKAPKPKAAATSAPSAQPDPGT
jgi:hypothetical protein